MNYRDMIRGPLNKRFSMNFLDTVGRPHKRFSMNYFDTVEEPGYKEQKLPRKRFSMNFMDVIGDSRRR